MKPGTLVGYLGQHEVYLGRLQQPILFAGERRWSVEWLDGYRDTWNTYPEDRLYRVIPETP